MAPGERVMLHYYLCFSPVQSLRSLILMRVSWLALLQPGSPTWHLKTGNRSRNPEFPVFSIDIHKQIYSIKNYLKVYGIGCWLVNDNYRPGASYRGSVTTRFFCGCPGNYTRSPWHCHYFNS